MKTTTLIGITLGIAFAIILSISLVTCISGDAPKVDSLSPETLNQVDTPKEVLPPPPPKVAKNVSPSLGQPFDRTGVVSGNVASIKETPLCTSGVLVDLTNRKILWEKNANSALPIASMTKIMSTILVFEAIENQKDLNFDTLIPVSKSASGVGGSQCYLSESEIFKLETLLQGMVIHSANDCTELLAEKVAGSSVAFVQKMNDKAKELGLKQAKFFSAHGLPPGKKTTWKDHNVASPMDMILMAEVLLQYPKAMEYSKQLKLIFRSGAPKGTTWKNTLKAADGQVYAGHEIEFTNSNYRLLKHADGCDGMKTGFTQKAKFCVTATCIREGRRLVAVVTGVAHGNSKKDDRAKLVQSLFNWGYTKK